MAQISQKLGDVPQKALAHLDCIRPVKKVITGQKNLRHSRVLPITRPRVQSTERFETIVKTAASSGFVACHVCCPAAI